MKKLILILILLSLSACGIFRKTRKESTYLKRDSVTDITLKADTAVLRQDKSETVETIVTDEKHAVQPEKVFKGEVAINRREVISDLTKGLTLLMDSGLVTARVALDTLNNVLRVEGAIHRIDSVTIHRVEKRVIKSDSKQESKGRVVYTKHNKEATLEKKTEKAKEPKNAFWFIIMIGAIVGLILLAVALLVRKRRTN